MNKPANGSGSEKTGVRTRFLKWASAHLAKEVEEKVDKLLGMKDDAPQRNKTEEELKELFVKIYDEFPDVASRLKELSRYVQENRMYDHATKGVVPCGKYALKIKRDRELSAHEIDNVNELDSQHFETDKNFQVARVYQPIRVTDPYIMLRDRLTNEERRKKSYVQIQGFLDNYNNLAEVFTHPQVAAFIRSKTPTAKQKQIESVLRKCLDEVFYFPKNAPVLVDGQNNPLQMDVDKLIQKRVQRLEDTLVSAREHTDCKLTDEDLKFVGKHRQLLYSLFPQDKEAYSRKINPTAWNIMLPSGGGDIQSSSIDDIFAIMDPKRLVHVDTQARFGHKSEDIHDIGDSYIFRDIPMTTEAPIFGRGTSRNFHAFLQQNYDYPIPLKDHEAVGFFRLARQRDYTLLTYLKGLVDLGIIDSKSALQVYVAEIRYQDDKVKEHLKNTKKLEAEQGHKETAEVLGQLDHAIKRMANFSIESFVKQLKKRA